MTQRFGQYLEWLDGQRGRMVELLERWGGLNTGTYNTAGLEVMAREVLGVLQEIGEAELATVGPQRVVSDAGAMLERALGAAVTARARERTGRPVRVLLGIHMDTVFGVADAFQAVTRGGSGGAAAFGGVMHGPGVCDAKGGLVVMLFALMALERSEFAKGVRWEVVVNADEEIGSPGSAGLFAAAARRNDVGLLFEPALPDGALVSSRKGSGVFTFVVRGKTAHAGRDAAAGRNAIHALAGFISSLAKSAPDYPGIVINTGWIGGGGAVNIVPELAVARVNVRVADGTQQEAFERDLAKRVAEVGRAAGEDGIRIESHGGFHSPPKELTAGTLHLLEQLKECGGDLRLNLAWRPTGGACDGNRLAAAGLATVDSLGVRGGAIHTDQEFVELDSLVERAKLTALYLMRVGAGELNVNMQTRS